MRATSIGVMAVLALGCGKGDEGKTPPAPSRDAAVPPDAAQPAPLGALDGQIPKLTGDAVVALAPPPIAVVLIDEDEHLRVAATGGSWAKVTAADFASTATAVESLDALPAALLTILEGAAGPAGEAATAMRAELAAEAEADPEAPEEPRTGWSGDREVSLTYAAEPGAALPVTTPLVIAHPGASGTFVVEVVDRIGGALAVAHGPTVRVFRIGFPWENAGWGGATLADVEAPAVDVHLDINRLVVSSDAATATEVSRDPAGLRAALDSHGAAAAATPAPTIDVMVPTGTTVQAVIDALAALDGVTSHRLGVGVSPWLEPIDTGRYGTVSGPDYGTGGDARDDRTKRRFEVPKATLGDFESIGELDKAIIRRYFKRHMPKLAYCYEKHLLANPKLAGTVTSKLAIDGSGLVISVASEGVSPEVASCVSGVIKVIEFPKPHGSLVQVTMPITFEPTGG